MIRGRILGRNASDLVYADPKTFSGPDENPKFDEDDELVFMARHLGPPIGKALKVAKPPNTKVQYTRYGKNNLKRCHYIQDEIVEVKIGDPDQFDNVIGYVYLFILEHPDTTNENTDDLVSYTFNLTNINEQTGSNDYIDAYKWFCEIWAGIHKCKDEVMNPEDSWFKSDHYQRHFKENW